MAKKNLSEVLRETANKGSATHSDPIQAQNTESDAALLGSYLGLDSDSDPVLPKKMAAEDADKFYEEDKPLKQRRFPLSDVNRSTLVKGGAVAATLAIAANPAAAAAVVGTAALGATCGAVIGAAAFGATRLAATLNQEGQG